MQRFDVFFVVNFNKAFELLVGRHYNQYRPHNGAELNHYIYWQKVPLIIEIARGYFVYHISMFRIPNKVYSSSLSFYTRLMVICIV